MPSILQESLRPLTGERGLFLVKCYGADHLAHLGYRLHQTLERTEESVWDLPATIKVTTDWQSRPLRQTIVLEVQGLGTFTHDIEAGYDFYTMLAPDTEGREGTIYLRGTLPQPQECNTFWIQQFPSLAGPFGRLTMDIWQDFEAGEHITPRIVGVFKTNDNNFGAQGKGIWDISPSG